MDPDVNVAASTAGLRGDGEPLRAMPAALVRPLPLGPAAGPVEP